MSSHSPQLSFSLGEALLGFGCPSQAGPWQPPEPWLSFQFSQYLDPEEAVTLFRSCIGGWELMLRTRTHFCIRLDLDRREEAVVRSISAAKAALAKRGQRPSQLTLVHRGMEEQQLIHTLHSFTSCNSHVTTLELPHTTTAVLTAAAHCLPNLSTLQLASGSSAVLPQPSLFPSLTDLSITWRHGDSDALPHLLRSIAPYLTQLQSLTLTLGSCCDTVPWPGLFDIPSPSHTLTQFTTDQDLSSDLLSLLSRTTPSVQHLNVRNLPDSPSQHITDALPHCHSLTAASGAVFSDEVKGVGYTAGRGGGVAVQLGPDGTRLDTYLLLSLTPEGIPHSVAHCLPHIRFTHLRRIKLQVDRHAMSADQLPTALKTALQQLTPLQSPDTLLQLKGAATYTPELVEVLKTVEDSWSGVGVEWLSVRNPRICQMLGSPALEGLELRLVRLDCLNSALVDALMETSARVLYLRVNSCEVPAGSQHQYQGQHWTWDVLEVIHADLHQLVRLPSLRTDGECELCLENLTWTVGEDTVQLAERFDQWLNGAHCSLHWLVLTVLSSTPSTQQPALLRATPRLLRLLPQPRKKLKLQGWALCFHTLAALSRLPRLWTCRLHLDWYEWLPPRKLQHLWPHKCPRPYRWLCEQLGSHVPHSISTLVVTLPPVFREECVMGVCISAGRRRREGQPLHVVAEDMTEEACVEVNRRLRAQAVGHHITVGNWW